MMLRYADCPTSVPKKAFHLPIWPDRWSGLSLCYLFHALGHRFIAVERELILRTEYQLARARKGDLHDDSL